MFSCVYGLKANAPNYGVEFLGAVVGDVLIGIPSGLAAAYISSFAIPGMSDMGPVLVFAEATYISGGVIGAPLGTVYTGKKLHRNGSVLGAYVGGVIGTGLGLLILSQTGSKIPTTIAVPVCILLPPFFSVIGYNNPQHKTDSQSILFNKNLPSLGLTIIPERHGDKISPNIGANITFRF